MGKSKNAKKNGAQKAHTRHSPSSKGSSSVLPSWCFWSFVAVILALSVSFALMPNSKGWFLFSYDHLLGRVGMSGDGLYHCRNNRFGSKTNFSGLVHTPTVHEVVPPPTIEWKDYTPELMKKVTDNYRLPVLIKGMFKDSFASKNWSLDFFDKHYGNQSIIYHELEFPITGITSSFQRHNKATTLSDFIKRIKAGEKLVLGNDHYLMIDYPELVEQLELNRWGTFDDMPIKPLSLRFFSGGNWTGVGWHAATSHNLFVEVVGKKLFKWFPPQHVDASNLHPTLSNKLPAIEHCEGHWYDENLPTMEVVLEAGDAIYTPAWVWHATRHLDNTIAVGLRMESFLHDVKTQPILAFLSEFSSDLPGLPLVNALTRGLLHATGVRLQGQALSRHEKEHGYKYDWLRDYLQAGGKLKSESSDKSQWKL